MPIIGAILGAIIYELTIGIHAKEAGEARQQTANEELTEGDDEYTEPDSDLELKKSPHTYDFA